jgi:outer membrane protein, adhesin transport system
MRYSSSFWTKLSLVVLFSCQSTWVCGQTLEEALQQTVKTNPEILLNVKNWMASEQAIKGAQGGYLPSVDLIADFGRERSNNSSTEYKNVALNRRGVGVKVTQNLFTGFGTVSEVERNQQRARADIYQTQGVSDDVSLLTTKAYLDVLRDEQIVSLAQKNYEAHQKIYKMIKQRAATGFGREADTTQALGRVALAKTNLLAAQSHLLDSQTIYQRLVGVAPFNLITPQSPSDMDLPSNEERAVQWALNSHPTLRAANADVEEARAQHKASLAANSPKVDAVLSASKYKDVGGVRGRDDDYLAMLQMSYNLFRGGSDFSRQKETALLMNKAEEIRNRTYKQVIESMKLSWSAFQTSKDQMSYLKEHRDASIKTVDSYRKQFMLNKRTLLDVLDSENEVFTASTAYTTGQFTLLFNKFRVLNSAGYLLPYMHVDLQQPSSEKLGIVTNRWNTPRRVEVHPLEKKSIIYAENAAEIRQQAKLL